MAGGAERVFELSNTDLHIDAPGTTFAGRDIFAPVAAHLCNGGAIEDVGPEIDSATVMPGLVPIPTAEKHDAYGEGLRCEVTWVDGYGNCQLNVGPDEALGLLPILLRSTAEPLGPLLIHTAWWPWRSTVVLQRKRCV
jgi:S-adenosylmethionine hydrolase